MRGAKRLWIFTAWLGIFYTAWLIVLISTHGYELALAHWPIAAAMSVGSYFAGSTPMGGGTVGFPVLVFLFGEPARLGRDFSFAVQSIGMTSASIFIVATGTPLAWSMLRWAIVGSLIGTPLGLTFLAPLVPGAVAKLLFAVVWASFGILTLLRIDPLSRQEGFLADSPGVERLTGLCIGFFGGSLVASITGVGIDMLIYVVLVLARRADLRIGIPTSVVLMAVTSLVGIAWQTLALNAAQPELFGNWLAAAPVVAVGAPFGALIVHRIGRRPTLLVVALLCVGQFVWTVLQEYKQLGVLGVASVSAVLLIVLRLFESLARWGARLAGTRVASDHESALRVDASPELP